MRLQSIHLWTGFALLLTLGAAALFYQQRPFRAPLAGFVTDLKGRSFAQRHNILRASESFSGTVLNSYQTFSLNQAAGPYTRDRGFLPERSFINHQSAETYGGGVCQLASTLYNAAQLAGLTIIERVPHSQEILSVPQGHDATLAFGVSDLKLKNPYPFPIKIVSRVINDQLLLEIWGKEKNHARP